MDLQLKVEESILYIRVAILVKTKNGFLFEKKSGKDYYFSVGGKIKINESSKDAAIREVKEELDFDVKDLIFRSVIENLYTNSLNEKIHEICFVYETVDVYEKELPEGFYEISMEKVSSEDIRPSVIPSIIKNRDCYSNIVN